MKLKRLWLCLTAKLLLLNLTLCLNSCAHYSPKFWLSDYENVQIIGGLEGEVQSCALPGFNKFACLHEDEILKLLEYLDYCSTKNIKISKKEIKHHLKVVLRELEDARGL